MVQVDNDKVAVHVFPDEAFDVHEMVPISSRKGKGEEN